MMLMRPDKGQRLSKMVSVGGSSSNRKRREPIDLDYRPEEEEAPVTNQSKRARSTLNESTAAGVGIPLGEARRMEEPMIPVTSEPSIVRPVPVIPFPYQMKDSVPRPISTPTSSPSLIVTPFQFQLNDVNDKFKVMEGTVRALAA